MKRFILVLLALSLLVGTATANDYYVESDFNLTVPVNVSASSSAYLIVELENGFTPTSDVYNLLDATEHTSDWTSTESFDSRNKIYTADAYIYGSIQTGRFGFVNSSYTSNSIYCELNTDGTDYIKAKTYVNSTPYETTLSGTVPLGYYLPLTIRTNNTHAIMEYNSNEGTVTPITSYDVNVFFDEAGTTGGLVKNQIVRQWYENEPTVTVYPLSSTLAFVEIENPNDFALNGYQITFDSEITDQTDESLNITEYSNIDTPIPLSPTNNENMVFEYPPVVNEITLTWQGNGGSSYYYEVRDIGGTLVASGTTSSTSAIVEIPEGAYYWNVESDLTESMETINAYFTISNTYITDGYTAVVGTVYEMEGFVKTPIPQAVVYIYNDTFSDHETVGPDGYFSFTGLTALSTYYLKASATDYDTSEIGLVTPAGGETTAKDLLLVPETKYYDSHKVRFVVQTIWGSVYPGVDVTAYKTGSINSLYSGSTGTDGSITFEMDEEVEYRITFVNATQGINEEITIYPMSNLYTIYPTADDYERESDDIKFGAVGNNINLTAGYINASFLDSSSTTTLAELWINETDGTNLYYFSTTNSSATWSQVVAANNTTYLVHFELQNTELTGSFLQDRVISFSEGVTGPFNFGFTEQWHYQLLGTALILFVGLLFGAVNAQMGAIVVVLLGWFNVYTGWYPSNVKTILMLMMATLVAGAFYLRKGEDIR